MENDVLVVSSRFSNAPTFIPAHFKGSAKQSIFRIIIKRSPAWKLAFSRERARAGSLSLLFFFIRRFSSHPRGLRLSASIRITGNRFSNVRYNRREMLAVRVSTAHSPGVASIRLVRKLHERYRSECPCHCLSRGGATIDHHPVARPHPR